MINVKSISLAIFAIVATIGLTGCEQLGQAATEAVDKAKQTAGQTFDEARQAGSVEEAKQTADQALQDLRGQAAGLLQQASQYLNQEPTAETGALETEALETDAEPAYGQ